MNIKLKTTIIFTLTILLFSVVSAMGQNKSASDSVKQDSITYTCPMHPEILLNEPGICPKCGMELVKKSKTSEKVEPKHKMGMMNGMIHTDNPNKKNKLPIAVIVMSTMMVVMMTTMIIVASNR